MQQPTHNLPIFFLSGHIVIGRSISIEFDLTACICVLQVSENYVSFLLIDASFLAFLKVYLGNFSALSFEFDRVIKLLCILNFFQRKTLVNVSNDPHGYITTLHQTTGREIWDKVHRLFTESDQEYCKSKQLKQIARKFIDFEKYTCVNICSLYPYFRSVVEKAKPRYYMYINCFNLYWSTLISNLKDFSQDIIHIPTKLHKISF